MTVQCVMCYNSRPKAFGWGSFMRQALRKVPRRESGGKCKRRKFRSSLGGIVGKHKAAQHSEHLHTCQFVFLMETITWSKTTGPTASGGLTTEEIHFLMKQMWQISRFVRRLRVEVRFGRLSRVPLRFPVLLPGHFFVLTGV